MARRAASASASSSSESSMSQTLDTSLNEAQLPIDSDVWSAAAPLDGATVPAADADAAAAADAADAAGRRI